MTSQRFGAICPGRSLGPDDSSLRSLLTLIGDERELALLEPPRTGVKLNLQHLMDGEALVDVQKRRLRQQSSVLQPTIFSKYLISTISIIGAIIGRRFAADKGATGLETNGCQFYAIANLDKTSHNMMLLRTVTRKSVYYRNSFRTWPELSRDERA